MLRDPDDPYDLVALAPAIYNLGLSAKALGRVEESERAFRAYTQLDSTSRYARVAALQLGETLERSDQSLRYRDLVEPIDGLRFGAKRSKITSTIGRPEFADTLGTTEVLTYPSRGLSLHLYDGDYSLVIARKPFSGTMHGVKLGAAHSDVTEELGEPVSISGSGWLEYPDLQFSVKLLSGQAVAFMARG